MDEIALGEIDWKPIIRPAPCDRCGDLVVDPRPRTEQPYVCRGRRLRFIRCHNGRRNEAGDRVVICQEKWREPDMARIPDEKCIRMAEMVAGGATQRAAAEAVGIALGTSSSATKRGRALLAKGTKGNASDLMGSSPVPAAPSRIEVQRLLSSPHLRAFFRLPSDVQEALRTLYKWEATNREEQDHGT